MSLHTEFEAEPSISSQLLLAEGIVARIRGLSTVAEDAGLCRLAYLLHQLEDEADVIAQIHDVPAGAHTYQ